MTADADDRAHRDGFRNLGAIIVREDGLEPVALIDLGGGTTPRVYPRRELDGLCNAMARGLLARGLGRGDRIALLAANRAEYLITILGAMRAGIVPVPVNFKLPPALIEHILRDSDSRLVVCDSQRAEFCPPDLPKVILGNGGGFEVLPDPGPFDAVRPQPSEAAMFLYTSGSTGRPKGVVLTHEGHLWVLRARPRRPSDTVQRVLVAAPLYHMNGLMTSLASLSQRNSTIVLLPFFTAPGYIDAIERFRCNVITAVPTMLALMLRERGRLERADLSSVEFVRMGSAPFTQALVDATRNILPAAEILNAYGTTEGGPVVFAAHPDGLARPELSVGYPHSEVRARLVDGMDREADEGILEVKCPALMAHYHKLPEETRKAITNDGFYVTGDLFRRDRNGFFYFMGRLDDMFVCGGENIYPGEIETVLERHPDVHQACVVPIADEIKGQKPVAFVTCKPGRHPTEGEVKAYAMENLALYQHPRRVWFLPEFPLAGTSKIDRNALTRRAAELVAHCGPDCD